MRVESARIDNVMTMPVRVSDGGFEPCVSRPTGSDIPLRTDVGSSCLCGKLIYIDLYMLSDSYLHLRNGANHTPPESIVLGTAIKIGSGILVSFKTF